MGSTAARQFIEEVKPDVCISGHIHESAGVDRIGPTQIFNAVREPDGWRIAWAMPGGGVQTTFLLVGAARS